MSYSLKVFKDYPIGYWSLDETSGTSAVDSSGCGNNGTYTGGITSGLIPLIPGGLQGSLITSTKSISFPIVNDYYGSTTSGGIADSNSLDSDCTFEIWFYPKFTTDNETPIFADSTNDIGIFYQSGDIIFKFGDYLNRYTLPYISKSHHIVAVYSVNYLLLYIDGVLVNTVAITSLPALSNEGLTLEVGPTLSTSDSFVVDAPAVYRYSLTEAQIKSHYNELETILPLQVAFPDGGRLFEAFDNNISTKYTYSYPANRSWNYFLTDDLFYNSDEQSISILKTDTAGIVSVELNDYITLPLAASMNSSKIEWYGENGITVEVSLDGTTYSTCTNNAPIPGFTTSSFSTEREIYLKITLDTADSSTTIPKLYNLAMSFYNEQTLFSSTSADYITGLNDIAISSKKYPILSRDARNGIRVLSGSGFYANTTEAISTIEFFYTPSALTNSALVSTVSGDGAESNYSWVTAGSISKTNIAAIYVNGVDKTSQTSISNVFTAGEIYHVVIVYTSAVSDAIKFNHSSAGAVSALYQNIALYPTAFNSTKVTEHYDLYMEKSAAIADDSSITVTEDGPQYYSNDWVVIQNI